MIAALRGESDAGNRIYGFDEGEIAPSAATLRHCSLLYKINMMLTMTAALVTSVNAAVTNEVGRISLNDNVTVEVPAGATYIADSISGYGWRLTKTGPGTLVVNCFALDKVKLTVAEGTLEIPPVDALAELVADAFFHVDASASSSFVTETQNGTNFVIRWNDVRGNGHPYAARTIGDTTLGRNDPYLGVDPVSGRTVVDFGTTYNTTTRSDGWGAALMWSEAVTRPMDIFVVERHNADMRSVVINGAGQGITGNTAYRNQALLGGSAAGYTGLVPGNPFTGHDSVPVVMSSAMMCSTAKASFRVDCGPEMNNTAASQYYPGYDQHVYGISPTASDYIDGSAEIKFNAFACERKFVYGGQTLGEVIVFTNLLTTVQRDKVNGCLMRKWKGLALAELTLEEGAVVSVSSGTTLLPEVFINHGGTVIGGGRFAPAVTRTDDTLVAMRGDVVDDPLLAADAWFHVDASITNMFGMSSGSSTNVYCWSDVRGRVSTNSVDRPSDGGRYAWSDNSSHPWIVPDYANGLTVLDFGPGWRNNCNLDNSRKTSMQWSEPCMSPRTFLIVVEDHPETREWTKDTDWKRNQAFVGNMSPIGPHDVPNYPIFGRPNRASDDVNSPYVLSSYGQKAKFYLDGTKVDAPTTAAFPDGLHLVTIETDEDEVLSGNQPCNYFACERGNLYGGQRLAEVLVFSNRLSAAERTWYEDLLMTKWFAANSVESVLASVVVTNGASYELKYQSLTVTDSLVLGGTLKATAVSAPATITLTEPSAVAGSFAVPAGATVTFAGDCWDIDSMEPVKVLDAASLSVTSRIAGRIASNPRSRRVVVEARADGLYATFLPSSGMCIFVR